MNLDGKSLDITQDNLAKLKQLFPNLVKEGEIDLNELKATFGQEPTIAEERYGLGWAGKYEAFKQVQEQTSHTLLPDRANSLEFDQTENVFIEGENLDVLKILQKSYYGQIKMIYIDPPYNTGNDHFIYPDKYAESKADYLQRSGATDEQGYLNKADLFRKNSRENGQFHSVWLSMMYPRLYLARNLLREDGVIFVSIDDNEVANLRLLMDEVFGEENFVAQIIWKKAYGGGAKAKHVVGLHEYIFCYARNKIAIESIELPPDPQVLKYYKYRDDKYKIRGPYRLQPLATTSMDERPNLRYPIPWKGKDVWPEKQWQWSKERVLKALENDELVFAHNNDKWTVSYKQYLRDEDGKQRAAKPYSVLDGPYTQKGTAEIKDLFGDGKVFSFPKPSELIGHLVSYIFTDKEAIILDFFSGSSVTAQAVLELNRKDNSNRRFIMIQLPELTDNLDYPTIADIGRARVRKVIEQMNGEHGQQLSFETPPTLGFRSFTLAPSNFKIWRRDLQDFEEIMDQLELFQQPTRSDDKEAMLWELLLKAGYPLSSQVETKVVEGATLYLINGGVLMIALQAINQAVVDMVRQAKPTAFICLDALFNEDDQLKTNTSLQFQDEGIVFKAI